MIGSEEFGQERPAVHLFDHVDTCFRFVFVDGNLDFGVSAFKHGTEPVVAELSGPQFFPGPGCDRDAEHAVAVGRRVVLVVDQKRQGILLAVFERRAVERDQQFGRFLAGGERYRRRNGEQFRFVACEDRYGQGLVLDDAFYGDGDRGDIVADTVLRGYVLGKVDLCTVDIGTCCEVIVVAGREKSCGDGDGRQKEYF